MDAKLELRDELTSTMERGRPMDEPVLILGRLRVERHNERGELVGFYEGKNLITAEGDQLYASRGAAKTGAGAALVTYLAGSNKAFDATFPSAAGGVVTYKRTYAPGEATTASAITEAVIVNDTIATDATSAAAATISRALVSGVGSKAAGDTLTITWTHTILGA